MRTWSRSPRWAAAAGWIVAGGAGIWQAYAALTGPPHDRLADLHVYLGSVRALRDGGSPYDFVAANGDPFTYPPFASLVLYPLAHVPEPLVRLLWTIATLAAIALIARLAVPASGRPDADGLRNSNWLGNAGWLAAALTIAAPGSSNLRLGQISLFLAALIMLDCVRGPSRWQGVATGIAAAIKLTPLAFVPYLWLSGRRRAAITALATFLAATALTWAVLPSDSHRFWVTELWRTSRIGNLAAPGNQSLNGLAQRLGINAPMTVGLIGLIALLTAYGWVLKTTVDGDSVPGRLAGTVVVGAAALLASPVSWSHHQVWLVLAAAIPLGAWWTTTVLTIMILPVAAIGDALPPALAVVPDNARVVLALIVVAMPWALTRKRYAVSGRSLYHHEDERGEGGADR